MPLSGVRMGLGALAAVLVSFVTLIAFASDSAVAAATPINLGSATPYAIVAASTITNTGSSVITGDVGLSPGTAITGFPPGHVNGTTDAADATSLGAQNSSTAAYLVAAGETPTSPVAGGTLGGTTLQPGIYKSTSSLALTGTLTLNGGGNANAVFIFQAGSTLTTASGSSVVLEGGAQACNVFWTVGSSATLGTTTSFVGTILAKTSVSLSNGASVQGRLLAQTGAVTLISNTVNAPTCAAATTTTTTATTTTTTATTTTTTATAPTTTLPGSKGTTTTTKPAKRRTTTTLAKSSTIIPVGAPKTGEGGAAGSGPTPLGLLGLGALGVGVAATSLAVRSRRRRG
ncbi:MAG TPA: ice-binding family protein [Acidimicrobiales bacterium]|nr:ice-binding family protein [Acidimicrobiales bacterium]